MTDLNTLFPIHKTLTFDGQEFTVREFIAAEFPMVASLGNRLADVDLLGIAPLFEHDSDKVFALLASVTGKPIETIKQMRISAMTELTAAIIEANLDFFVRALPTIMQRVVKAATGSTVSNP